MFSVSPAITASVSPTIIGAPGAFDQSVPSLLAHLSVVCCASTGVLAALIAMLVSPPRKLGHCAASSANAAVPGTIRFSTIKRARSRLSDLFFIFYLQVSCLFSSYFALTRR